MNQEQALEASLQKTDQLCRMLEEKEAAKAKQLLSSNWKLMKADGLERNNWTCQTPVCSSRKLSFSSFTSPDQHDLSLGGNKEDADQHAAKQRDSIVGSCSKPEYGTFASKKRSCKSSKGGHGEVVSKVGSKGVGTAVLGEVQQTDNCEPRPAPAPSLTKCDVGSVLVDPKMQDEKTGVVGPQAFIDPPSWKLKRGGSEQLSRRSSMSTSSRTTLGGESSLLPEVLLYDAFRAEHGTYGGWLSDDHADYERILRTNRGDKDRAHAAVAAELFHISPEEIDAHSRWYDKHVELLGQKKAAIAAWKDRREAERRERLQQEQPPLEPTPEERRQSQLQRQESKKRVQEWKAAREREQQEIADAEAARREAAAAAAAAEAASAQAAKHEQLQAFRERKAAEQSKAQEAASAAAEEAKAQMQLTEEQIEAVQQRTQEHIKRQAALTAAREARKQAQRARLESLQQKATAALGVKVEADPERVLAPTRSFNQRGAAEEPGPVRYGGTSIRNVAKKAVPAWRKTG